VLPTGALGLLIAFAQHAGFFEPFATHLDVPLKTCLYTPLQKLQTLICSLAVGCAWTKAINHKLRPYPSAAALLGMTRFPEQSSVNRFLHRLGPAQSLHLELIGERLLERFGLWQQHATVDLDIDSTGLLVYGETYEQSRKGYFPRQRGRRGYRLALASTSQAPGPEILAAFLDPANAAPAGRLWDCVYQAAEVVGSLARLGVIRADAVYGTGPNVEHLLDLGLGFMIKGCCDKTALNFARTVEPTRWEPVDFFTRVCDLGPQSISHCRHPIRVVLVELMTRRYDHPSFSHLYTTLSPTDADAAQLFERYNGRQRIEALIKTAKHGLSIKHLRTRRLAPIRSFLQVAALTFNLLVWFRHYLLAQVDLDRLGLFDLTHTLMDIPAKCAVDGHQLRLSFPEHHPLASALARL
jgi:hypothetical protein